jgi:hypothetical protein
LVAFASLDHLVGAGESRSVWTKRSSIVLMSFEKIPMAVFLWFAWREGAYALWRALIGGNVRA